MTGLPINMYLNPWYGQADAASINSLTANLAKHGVKYLQSGNCVDDSPSMDTSDAYVQDIAAHGTAGYCAADECRAALIPAVFDQYTRLRRFTVNAENRTVVASGSSFTDRFGPYQAHVYVLATGGTAEGGQTGSASPNGRGASY